MKKVFPFLLFCLITATSFAGDSEKKSKSERSICSYTGVVLDAENAEALTGATIKVVELDREVFADFDGNFTLENIPEGTYTLEISFVSYDTKIIEGFEITPDKKSKRFLL